MTQKLVIPNRLPGMNDIIAACKIRRGSWTKYMDIKNQYGLEIIYQIKEQGIKPIDSMVSICFKWYEKSKRRDKDNIAAGKKFILDALSDTGIIVADDWRYIHTFTDEFYCEKYDMVEVLITEIESEV